MKQFEYARAQTNQVKAQNQYSQQEREEVLGTELSGMLEKYKA